MEFRKEPGRIFAVDAAGKLLAEVTFPEREGVAVINRQDGRKARPTCSYAVHWFETHPEEQDLLE